MPELEGEVYSRQNKIQDLKIPKVATVVGCGGTGFWTALLLAMSGVQELIIIDPDNIEASNLNRLPLRNNDIGKTKIAAISEYIEKIRNPIRIETHYSAIEKSQDCQILRGIVFCCTDNLKSQQLICAYCKKNKLAYQRIGYDGTTLNVSKAFPLSFKEKEEETGYTITPSWVIPAVLAAAAGIASKLFKEICLMDDISKLSIKDCSTVPQGIQDIFIEEGENNILDDIHEHIPDGYGNCENCDHVPDGYGYCEDCDQKYSDGDIQEIKDEAYKEGHEEGYEKAKEEFSGKE